MKYVLITGASSGIGEEFAKQLATQKRSLILVARSEEKLNALAKELMEQHGIQVHVIKHDLAQLDSAKKVFEACQQKGLEVDFLINDAGVGLIEQFDAHPFERLREMLLLNIATLTELTYLFLPQLKANKGMLLNVASQAGFQPIPYMSVYAASKAYVLNFTEGLRVELEDSGVKVCALCPGTTQTRFFERAGSSIDDIRSQRQTPKEVVQTALDGLEKGKSVVISGGQNQLMVFLNRFLPRAALPKLTQHMVKKKH
jgi:short-subunit dehydrogenase